MSIKDNFWPKGLSTELAVIDMDVDQAKTFFGIEFEIDSDDLDSYYYSFVKFSKFEFALVRYIRAPLPGITLIGQDNLDIGVQIYEFMNRYNFKADMLLWRAN